MSFGDTLKRLFGIHEPEPAEILLSPEQLAVTPMPSGSFAYGASVNETFTNAIAAARQHKRPVHVDINGLRHILVDAQSTVEAMMAVYNAAENALYKSGQEAAAKIIAKTPEYQRLHQMQKERTHILQQHMDMLMQDLPQRLEDGLDSTIAWIGSFSKAANHLNVGYNHRAVLIAFDKKGYSRLMADDPSQDAAGLARRIIGTMMEQLEDIGNVHAGLSKQCTEYAHIASRERARKTAPQ